MTMTSSSARRPFALVCLAAALALVVATAPAQAKTACPELISSHQYLDSGWEVVGDSCWLDINNPTQQVSYAEYQFVTEHWLSETYRLCDGSIETQETLLQRTVSSTCWEPTTIVCAGVQDWYPPSICSF